MKKVFSFILSLVMLSSVFALPSTANASGAVLNYSFEGQSKMPKLFGNAKTQYDEEKKSNVLFLDGTDGTYAEIPQGFFDKRDKMTISLDVKSLNDYGNFFTFTYGKDTNHYSFLRVRGTNTVNIITDGGKDNERQVYADFRKPNEWQNITLVVDGLKTTMYIDATVETHYQINDNMGTTTSDLGENLLAYLGKSFYGGDAYFKGMIDNFRVYDSALTEDEVVSSISGNIFLAKYVTIGTLNEDFGTQLDWEYKVVGTDNHTAVTSAVNRKTGEITSYIKKGTNLAAVPVTFRSAVIENAQITVDGKAFKNGSKLNLNKDRKVTIKYNNRVEEYTIKVPVYAFNPVLPGQYADPDIDYFDGKYWIYPTTDGYHWWSGTQLKAFSSTDLVNWTDEGVVLDVNKDSTATVNEKGVEIAISPWSVGSAWAPTIEKKNDKYYLYYCGRVAQELGEQYGTDANGNAMMAIGVAVADSPTGPFTACEKPVCYTNLYARHFSDGILGEQIDPCIFTDDDGSSYILTGGSCAAFIAKLSEDMTCVDESYVKRFDVIMPKDLIPSAKQGADFLESFYLFKRNGKYHFTWSCYGTNGEDYTVKYATSSSLDARNLSGITTLLTKDTANDMLCTGHQSFVYRPDTDECYIAYHRFYTPLYAYPTGLGFHRETCIEKVTFNDYGRMNPISPTMHGVAETDTTGYSVKAEKQYYDYTGKAVKPNIVVTDTKGNTISAKCYDVKYTNNTKVGTGTAKITFKNGFVGTAVASFKIVKHSSTNHTYATNSLNKATAAKNGSKVQTCKYCGVKKKTTLYSPKAFTLSATSYTYDGKVKKPSVTVKDSKGKALKNGTDYTVSYANGRKNVGKYAVKITFKGDYSGTKTLYFTIKPKNTSISKLTAGKKKLTVKIKKYTVQTTGYQIQYSTSSKFTSAKTINTKNTTTAKTISSLKSGKKYYVRIRTYKTVNGTKYYSAWSSAKTVKVK